MQEQHFIELQNKYTHLKDLVGYLREILKVGDTLPSERDLVEILGYSKSTIRESLIRLECFGYISIEHGKRNVLLRELE